MRPCNRLFSRSPMIGKLKDGGLTMVEILVVTGIAVLFIGALTFLFTQFRRSFAKGEESTVVIQEGVFFLANLRNDLINAVMPSGLGPEDWSKSVKAGPDSLEFSLYRDADGNIDTVTYQIAGKSLKRTLKNAHPKPLIEGNLASLSWKVGSEVIPTGGSGTRRLWVELFVQLGGQGKPGITSKPLNIHTRLFPARLNRQLNDGL